MIKYKIEQHYKDNSYSTCMAYEKDFELAIDHVKFIAQCLKKNPNTKGIKIEIDYPLTENNNFFG